MSHSVGNPYMCSGVQKSFYKKCHRKESGAGERVWLNGADRLVGMHMLKQSA